MRERNKNEHIYGCCATFILHLLACIETINVSIAFLSMNTTTVTTDEQLSGGGGGGEGGQGGSGSVGGGDEGGKTNTAGEKEAKEGDTGADSGGAGGGRGRGAGGRAGRGRARHTRVVGAIKIVTNTSPSLYVSTVKIFIKLLSLIHRQNLLLLLKRKVQKWGRLPLPSQAEANVTNICVIHCKYFFLIYTICKLIISSSREGSWKKRRTRWKRSERERPTL